MPLTLRQLQQFIAVAETLSFREGAERLNMAQPPLTHAIKQLEEEVGHTLIERTNRITGLTAAGTVLLKEAKRAIDQADRALKLAQSAGCGATGSLRIGFVDSVARRILPRLLMRFREAFPRVNLELEEIPTAQQVTSLAEDKIDLGMTPMPIFGRQVQNITTKVLSESELVLAVPSSHRLSSYSGDSIELSELADESWILFPSTQGRGLHALILGACAKAGFVPRVEQRAIQMGTSLGLVAAGLGIALVPKQCSENNREGVAFKKLTGVGSPIPYNIALAWCEQSMTPTMQAFIQIATGEFDK